MPLLQRRVAAVGALLVVVCHGLGRDGRYRPAFLNAVTFQPSLPIHRLGLRRAQGAAKCAPRAALRECRNPRPNRGMVWQMAVGDGDDTREGSAWCPSAGMLQNFVMQRAIQTKLYHLNQVRNQPTYEFLQDFLDHGHLQVVRVTDYDFKCLFHGANGLKTDWKSYIDTLHATPTKEVIVHFNRQSKGDTTAASSYEESFGEMPPWAQAAASRRQNPYLDEWGGMPHMAYNETINAGRMAQSILEIGSQLAKEMSFDLQNLEKENEILRLQYQNEFVLRNASAGGGVGGIVPVWVGGEDAFIETESTSGADSIIKWESSVLRSSSWDLILRLLTKLSTVQVLAALADSRGKEPTYHWFRSYLADSEPAFDGHGPKGVDSKFLSDLLQQPLRISETGLIDPLYVAEQILKTRSELAKQWLVVLRDISDTWPEHDFSEDAAILAAVEAEVEREKVRHLTKEEMAKRQAAADALKRLGDPSLGEGGEGAATASVPPARPKAERRWTAPEGYVPKRKQQEKEAEKNGVEARELQFREGAGATGGEMQAEEALLRDGPPGSVVGASGLSPEIALALEGSVQDEAAMQEGAGEMEGGKGLKRETEGELKRTAEITSVQMRKEAEEAEQAARASQARAREMQEAIGQIKRRFADKLAAIAAAAVGKLAYGGSASPAAGAASDLAKFRKDSVARLKRDISE